jgi:hypothetical protein
MSRRTEEPFPIREGTGSHRCTSCPPLRRRIAQRFSWNVPFGAPHIRSELFQFGGHLVSPTQGTSPVFEGPLHNDPVNAIGAVEDDPVAIESRHDVEFRSRHRTDGNLEAPDGANAGAATAVVTWMRDPSTIPDSPYGEAAAVWVRAARPTPSGELLAAALAALDQVRSDRSELAELWAESDDAAWAVSLTQIEARLRA